MKKKSVLLTVAIGTVLLICSYSKPGSVAGSVSYEPAPTPSPTACPSPTVTVGRVCRLTGDADIKKTFIIPSNRILDCQGHTLRPINPGSDINNTSPQVAVFLNEAKRVVIRRCVIEGFDFGIFVINSKQTSLQRQSVTIINNRIDARYAGLTLMNVDDAIVTDNIIAYRRTAGRALYLGRNSDRNLVARNQFAGHNTFPGAQFAYRVPGPELSGSNPKVPFPDGLNNPQVVLIAESEGGEPTVLSAVVDRTLYQITTAEHPVPNSSFSEGNRFENNTIGSARSVDGVAIAVAEGTKVQGNLLGAGLRTGIRMGIQNNFARTFPGRCSVDSAPQPRQLCLDDSDCNIPNLPAKGTCTNQLPHSLTLFWITRHSWIENNTIRSHSRHGIITSGQGTMIKGNLIAGSTVGNGIVLSGKHAIETSVVTRNIVGVVAVGLLLEKTFQGLEATTFGSQVSLNEFGVNGSHVQTSPDYSLDTELSVGGLGNHWGTSCAVGLKAANPLVVDSHPFGVRINAFPTFPLPLPCPAITIRP